MDWWVTEAGGKPIGPLSTDVVAERIRAGAISERMVVCEVGGDSWTELRNVPPFAAALGVGLVKFDERAEHTVADVVSPADTTLAEATYDDPWAEKTSVDQGPRGDVTAIHSRDRGIAPYDETTEQTIVDQVPARRE